MLSAVIFLVVFNIFLFCQAYQIVYIFYIKNIQIKNSYSLSYLKSYSVVAFITSAYIAIAQTSLIIFARPFFSVSLEWSQTLFIFFNVILNLALAVTAVYDYIQIGNNKQITD